MKPVMLTKLNNRYSDEQTRFFKMCTLLDVRYKNSKDLYGEISKYTEAYTDLENHVKHICEEHNKIQDNQSPEEIPVTQGQDLASLSNICGGPQPKRPKFEIHAHEDDDEPLFVDDPFGEHAITEEINRYKRNVVLKAEEKDNLNILDWWKKNGSNYP